MENYVKMEKIGEGVQGTVYKAYCKRTGKIVAIKKISRLQTATDGFPASCLREVALLNVLSQSRNVIRLLSVEYVCMDDKNSLYLIFEYLDNCLKTLIENCKSPSQQLLSASLVRCFLHQLCKGLDYCHSHGVLHRDLKPQNILVSNEGILKIADLGLARSYSDPGKPYTDEVVSLWYRAPEILLGATHYSTPVDVWSAGCIFAEMVTGKPLFAGESEIGQLLVIFKLLGTPSESTWPGVTLLRDWHAFPTWQPGRLSDLLPGLSETGIHLLTGMLRFNPEERISAREALQHPYLCTIGTEEG